MIIVIEGAEKAGKTTLAHAFVDHWNAKYKNDRPMVYRHWGPISSDIEYSELLQHDTLDTQHYYIWDRGWASETVYANLLSRNRRARNDAWLMEMLHGRATPLKFIVVGDTDIMQALRTADDLPLLASEEQGEFISRFPRYRLLFNNMNLESLLDNISEIETAFIEALDFKMGCYSASVQSIPLAFVTSRNKSCNGDRWMPFSHDKCLSYLREFGPRAPDCVYMFSHEGDPTILNCCVDVVVQGGDAKTWVKYYTQVPDSRIHAVNMLRPTVKQDQELKQLMRQFRSRYERTN